jgi:hypothetical protein
MNFDILTLSLVPFALAGAFGNLPAGGDRPFGAIENCFDVSVPMTCHRLQSTS